MNDFRGRRRREGKRGGGRRGGDIGRSRGRSRGSWEGGEERRGSQRTSDSSLPLLKCFLLRSFNIGHDLPGNPVKRPSPLLCLFPIQVSNI